MSEPDEAFMGLVDEDDPNAPTVVVSRSRRSKPKSPKRKKVVRKVVRTPTPSTSKPVGFYKDGKGTTRPITAPGGKKAAKASKPVRVIKKIGKPVDWSEISKTRRYEDDAATLRKYGAVPIPAKGIIGRKGAPLIRWDEINQGYMPRAGLSLNSLSTHT